MTNSGPDVCQQIIKNTVNDFGGRLLKFVKAPKHILNSFQLGLVTSPRAKLIEVVFICEDDLVQQNVLYKLCLSQSLCSVRN